MKRKGLIASVVAAILVIALGITLIAAYLTLENYVLLGTQLFPRNEEVLDLRDRLVTAEEVDALTAELPDTRIIWSVPFQGGYVSSETKQLKIRSLQKADLEYISYFTQLEEVQAQECRDYEELLALYKEFPEVQVDYSVEIGGVNYSAGDSEIHLEALPAGEAQKLGYLPNLVTVDAMECPDYAEVTKLAEENPQWEVKYLKSIAGTPVDVDAVKLEVTEPTGEEAAAALAIMPKLKEVILHNPQAEGAELLALREKYPDVKIRWDVEIEGVTFQDDAREVDMSHAPLMDLEYARQTAAKFPELRKLIVERGVVENEEMAAYREEMREQFKVVWTVELGKICKARTDETIFMPIQQGDYYFNDEGAYNLRYCEDMVCMDVGHAPLHNCDFLKFMPKLKYLILAHTQIKDISPITACKELLFLELDSSLVKDYTPLQECTSLEDLNIGDTYADVEALCEMTWLKNLWCVGRGYGNAMKLSEALTETHVNFGGKRTVDNGWRMLNNYYEMRDMLGMEAMQ